MTKIFSKRKCKYINFFYSTQISNSKVCVLSSIFIVSLIAIFSVPSQPSRFYPSVKMTRILSCDKVSNLRYSPCDILPTSIPSSPTTNITLCNGAEERLSRNIVAISALNIIILFCDILPNAYDTPLY